MGPVKTEVKTEDFKTEQNVRTEQDYRGEGDTDKANKTVSFAKK